MSSMQVKRALEAERSPARRRLTSALRSRPLRLSVAAAVVASIGLMPLSISSALAYDDSRGQHVSSDEGKKDNGEGQGNGQGNSEGNGQGNSQGNSEGNGQGNSQGQGKPGNEDVETNNDANENVEGNGQGNGGDQGQGNSEGQGNGAAATDKDNYSVCDRAPNDRVVEILCSNIAPPPVDDAPVDDAPVDDAPVDDAPVADAPVVDAPVVNPPAGGVPFDIPVIQPEPAQPAEPATPAEPGEPGEPATPAEPAEPAKPAEPAQPNNPNTPKDPTPDNSDDRNPATPAGPGGQSQSDGPGASQPTGPLVQPVLPSGDGPGNSGASAQSSRFSATDDVSSGIPGSGAGSARVTSAPEGLPFVASTRAASLVNGEVVEFGIESQDATGDMVVSDGVVSLRMQVNAGDGLVVAAGPDGALRMQRSMTITLEGEGFAPESLVELSLLPGNIRLGVVRADSDGAFTVQVDLPPGVEVGAYNLKLEGTGVDGATREMAVGIEVVDDSTPLELMKPAPEFSLAGFNSTGVLLAVIILGTFFLIATRRRVGDDKHHVDIFNFGALTGGTVK
jgi:hypothetical protein